jgi:hypothetical protein
MWQFVMCNTLREAVFQRACIPPKVGGTPDSTKRGNEK